MTDAIIDLQDLHKSYSEGMLGRKKVQALRGVTFSVPRGTVFGLLGPNGAGKTTLIKVLLGLVRKSQGSGQMLGLPLGTRAGRSNVGYLPEHHRFPGHLTGNSALMYYGGLSGLGRSEILSRRDILLNRVGLEKWGRKLVRNYSKGMQQRLGIAQALLHQPELLILDEPTDGVDPVGRSDIRQLLNQLKDEGTTIFLNSHQLQEIELVCDQAVILRKGQVQLQGTIDEITQLPAVQVVFVVNGNEYAIRDSLSDVNDKLTVDELVPLDGQTVKIVVAVDDQDGVNRAVDALRAKSIDIVEMARRRTSLEEAFLNIVTATSELD